MIKEWFHRSHPLWENSAPWDESLKQKLGYYEIESIDNPCQIVLAINPKEYFKQFWEHKSNEKHKGVKKVSADIAFKNFAGRKHSLNDSENPEHRAVEKQKQHRFQVINRNEEKKW